MIGLEKSLQSHELIVLRIIGEWWELMLTGMDREQCAAALAETLKQINMQEELLYLQTEEAAVMYALATAGGRVPVAVLARSYGTIRPMGPGALEREQPWLDPQSPVEALWYRGFLYQAFDETKEGVVEFFYIPDEIREFQLPKNVEDNPLYTHEKQVDDIDNPSSQDKNINVSIPVQFEIAPHDVTSTITSLLALAQAGQLSELGERDHFFWTIAAEARLQVDNHPKKAAVHWLKQAENEALQAIWTQWFASSKWNALHHVPEIVCEGGHWQNDPIAPRRVLLDYLPHDDQWIDISLLIAKIKQDEPDFQRPNGNYDDWYIREVNTGGYLSGFDSWDKVEAHLLYYVLTQPMHWLGMIDISENKIRPTYNLNAWRNEQSLILHRTDLPIVIHANATLIVPVESSRYDRFQLTRIAELQPPVTDAPWVFELTAHSLAYAHSQGITIERILDFLEKVSDRPLPASVRRAIERWRQNNTEGNIQSETILRVANADIIKKLRQNDKTRPYMGESLGDLSVIILGNDKHFRQLVAQLGLLLG